MSYLRTSYKLVDRILAKDIYSAQGILLLAEGTRLQETDIGMLLNRGIKMIEVLDPNVSQKISSQMGDLWITKDLEMSNHYIENLELVKNLFEKTMTDTIAPLHIFMKSFTPLLTTALDQSFLLYPLHKVKGHDEYTYRHSINVGLLSAVIGKILCLTEEDILILGQMGLFHDIGKMKINKKILHKPGVLTADEFEIMKKHTVYGYEILKQMEGTDENIYKGALYHHERLDGSGYPEGLKNEEIPFLVQILSVADTYDAMCSDRIYQQKSSPYYASQELMFEMYRGKLNPTVVIPFVRHLIERYIGDKAIFDNGEVGEVVLVHPEEPHRPLVRIGEKYIDLRKDRKLKIVDLVSN